jgi:hypothetical protein
MVAGSNLICARNRFRASHDGPPNRHGHAGGRCRVPLLKRPPLSVVTIFESMRPAFFRASYCCLRRVVLVGQSSLCGGSLTGSGDLALHRLLRKLRGYGASGMAWTRPAYHLAIEPDWAHAAVWGKFQDTPFTSNRTCSVPDDIGGKFMTGRSSAIRRCIISPPSVKLKQTATYIFKGSLPLGPSSVRAGDAGMATANYSIKIEADPLNALRFRWTVCEGAQVHMRSPHSCATRKEAETEANAALLKLAENGPSRMNWST